MFLQTTTLRCEREDWPPGCLRPPGPSTLLSINQPALAFHSVTVCPPCQRASLKERKLIRKELRGEKKEKRPSRVLCVERFFLLYLDYNHPVKDMLSACSCSGTFVPNIREAINTAQECLHFTNPFSLIISRDRKKNAQINTLIHLYSAESVFS